MRSAALFFSALLVLVSSSCSPARSDASSSAGDKGSTAGANIVYGHDMTRAPGIPPTPQEGVAIFAGGCFWCMESSMEEVPGVISVTSGFTGGKKLDPSYEEVSAGGTGHAEAVRVVFDPRNISYDKLLEAFWHNVDPTQGDGQFCDIGNQYRSGIYYLDETQKEKALASRKALEAAKALPGPIVTEIAPAGTFYPAENYHQDFYKKEPLRYKTYRFGCGRDRRLQQLWGTSH